MSKLNRSDLKFYPSERLTDNDDGGGLALGSPIDGRALFQPISSIARVNGAFFARLAYAGVQRADDEPLIGSFVALTAPPKDVSVSYLLFKATKFGELRSEIIKRIEAYSVATIESRLTLLSTQTKGSKVVQAYQRTTEQVPVVGDVFCLRQDKKGYTFAEQYVQVVAVKSENRTFYDPETRQDFVRTVVQLEVSQKLTFDFEGVAYPSVSYVDAPCKIRETHVADAAEYYGIKPITAEIKKNTAQIAVSGVMEKIIPTNQIETPLADLSMNGVSMIFDSSKEGKTKNVSFGGAWKGADNILSLYVGGAIYPGSVYINAYEGKIVDKGGTLYLGTEAVGTVQYAEGILLFSKTRNSLSIYEATFRPITSASAIADTAKIDVSINNRSYNYVLTLDPIPAVGTLQVSYRSMGTWYTLYDDGNGKLKGMSESYGGGSVNFVLGTVQISCGELPDVDSSILLSWGTTGEYFNRVNNAVQAAVCFAVSPFHQGSLSWSEGGVQKSATCSGGKLTGAWTGTYQDGKVYVTSGFNRKPDNGVTVQYQHGELKQVTLKAPLRDGQGNVSLDVGDVPLVPGSVRVRWNLLIEDYDVETVGEIYTRHVDPYKTVRDDGNGKLVDEKGQQIGTVDYTNRRITFNPDTTVMIPKTLYTKTKIGEKVLSSERVGNIGKQVKQVVQDVSRVAFRGFEYVPAGASMPIDDSAVVEVWFFDSQQTKTETVHDLTVEIDVASRPEIIATGSLHFKFGEKLYFDRRGMLMTDLNGQTGVATTVGTVDYANGRIVLQKWERFTAVELLSLATRLDFHPVESVTFRMPVSPIRPSSLQVRATTIHGKTISVTANNKGELVADGVVGLVDVEYGVASLRFGRWVQDDEQAQQQQWYNAELVSDEGKVWQPIYILPESVVFNAVAYSYLPVDSEIVKIDMVRLPQDGRIPIFRRGDTILIHNTQVEEIGSAFTAGQVVQLRRGDVDRICVQDSDGNPVLAKWWTEDFVQGTIQFSTPLDLSGYRMPLKVKHVQEERNRILKVDIDGTLSLMFATKRDYPLENTYVSSVLIGGDLQVRASVPFTQRNWNNVWQNTPNGDQLLNKLNVKDYPIVLTDDGAITERWLIKWVSTTQFEVYGETVGFVIKTDALQDLAPINPSTNKPYFTIPKQAFGNAAPWASQDVIRFNTWGTLLPVWVLCAVQPTSNPLNEEDGFGMCLFGDTTE